MASASHSGSANDPTIDAIATRVRSVVEEQATETFEAWATMLGVSSEKFSRLMRERDGAINVAFLLDVIAAMVREIGVDPNWLLAGAYDAAIHRDAMLLAENRTALGAGSLREFVCQQYRRGASAAMRPKARERSDEGCHCEDLTC